MALKMRVWLKDGSQMESPPLEPPEWSPNAEAALVAQRTQLQDDLCKLMPTSVKDTWYVQMVRDDGNWAVIPGENVNFIEVVDELRLPWDELGRSINEIVKWMNGEEITMSPEDFVSFLTTAEAAGLVKVKKTLGNWSVTLTKKGRAAKELMDR